MGGRGLIDRRTSTTVALSPWACPPAGTRVGRDLRQVRFVPREVRVRGGRDFLEAGSRRRSTWHSSGLTPSYQVAHLKQFAQTLPVLQPDWNLIETVPAGGHPRQPQIRHLGVAFRRPLGFPSSGASRPPPGGCLGFEGCSSGRPEVALQARRCSMASNGSGSLQRPQNATMFHAESRPCGLRQAHHRADRLRQRKVDLMVGCRVWRRLSRTCVITHENHARVVVASQRGAQFHAFCGEFWPLGADNCVTLLSQPSDLFEHARPYCRSCPVRSSTGREVRTAERDRS